ncbi:MAG: polysaccharide ABC transporter ATP-binding protein [Candidatus Saccharimonadales bacterium]
MNGSDIAIHTTNVTKSFKLPHEKYSSLKSLLINFYRRKSGYEIQKALDDVTLEIKKGEFFGIVGRNGSGKSTLLKMLAQIYVPDSGEIWVNGKLTPFIELGVGFNMELTGRENVYLNGSLLGFSRKEMKAMYKDIVEFAELEPFMDQKLKNYSSGMHVRLAFSIAVRTKSEILLVDEVLAVGDMNFQRKCFDVFEALKKEGRTIVFISHDMESIRRFCDRAALLSKGKIEFIGSPEHVADIYTQQNAEDIKLFDKARTIKSGASITKLRANKSENEDFGPKDKVILSFDVRTERPAKCHIGLNLVKEDGQFIAGLSSQFQLDPEVIEPGKAKKYHFSFPADQLAPGKYVIEGMVYEIDQAQPIFFKPAMAKIRIENETAGWGSLNLQGKWSSD